MINKFCAINKGRGVTCRATDAAHVLEIEFLCIAPHPHAQESAMRHVEDVAKNGSCTSKQTQNNNATAKQHLQLKPSCAVLEISTSRKDRETLRKHQPNIPGNS
jgi:hypothetical protein